MAHSSVNNGTVPDDMDALERQFLVHNVIKEAGAHEEESRVEFDSDFSLSDEEEDVAANRPAPSLAVATEYNAVNDDNNENWAQILSTHRPKNNTGGKGVLADYEEAKRIKARRNETRILKQREALSRSGGVVGGGSSSATATTTATTSKRKTKKDGHDDDDDDDGNASISSEDEDAFFKAFRAERMRQMMAVSNLPRFGRLRRVGKFEFVDTVDQADPRTHVVIHLYEDYITACKRMNTILDSLAERYPHVMFLKLQATEADQTLSHSTLPAFLVYKGGKLCGDATVKAEIYNEKAFSEEDVEFMLAAKYGVQLPGVDLSAREKAEAVGGGEKEDETVFKVRRG